LGCSIASIIHPCIQQRQEKYTWLRVLIRRKNGSLMQI
jgi:hypothetical protein